MDSDIDQIIDILKSNYNFFPNNYYCYYDLNPNNLKELFNNKFKILVIVINYEENFKVFFIRFRNITKITSYNELEYTLNVTQNYSVNFIINDSGFCQINIIGKNIYKITNLLYIVGNGETKKANCLKLFF